MQTIFIGGDLTTLSIDYIQGHSYDLRLHGFCTQSDILNVYTGANGPLNAIPHAVIHPFAVIQVGRVCIESGSWPRSETQAA